MGSRDSKKPDLAETLNELYWNRGMSLSEIAELLGVNKTTILSWMKKAGIKRRTISAAVSNLYKRSNNALGNIEIDESVIPEESTFTLDDLIKSLQDTVEPVRYEFTPREDIVVPLPLELLEKREKDIVLTLVISDLHLGHETHLPETYWSCINNLKRVLRFLRKNYDIARFNLVCNGDIVSGKDVYKYQIFENLVQRGHWQVFLAERVLKKTLESIKEEGIDVSSIYLIKGTHESQESNFMLYLKKCLGSKAKYSSKHLLLDIAEPIGHYNVMFTHGYGGSSYYPVSYQLIRDLWKTISEYSREGLIVERIVTAHCHWLTPELELEGIKISETGGFQKWHGSIHQRPTGILLLLCSRHEGSVIPIRPGYEVVKAELSDPALEYKNMRYYAEILRQHFNLYETG